MMKTYGIDRRDEIAPVFAGHRLRLSRCVPASTPVIVDSTQVMPPAATNASGAQRKNAGAM
jgi:hypothetical protein